MNRTRATSSATKLLREEKGMCAVSNLTYFTGGMLARGETSLVLCRRRELMRQNCQSAGHGVDKEIVR